MTVNIAPGNVATGQPIAQLGRPSKYPEEFRMAVADFYRRGASLASVGIEFNLTKGQVAGMLSRAGIFKEAQRRGPAAPKKAKAKRQHALVIPKFNRVPFAERAAVVVPLNIPFLERNRDQCAQLYGDDPRTMTWCGHPCYGTLPYCLAHSQINYQPPQARNRAPRPR
jgi:hypothetical protein